MALVWVPTRLQPLTGGLKQVVVAGTTVRQVIDELETRFPGIKPRLYDPERDTIARGLAVTVDGVTGELGLLEKVGEQSEVHFLPAIAGGA